MVYEVKCGCGHVFTAFIPSDTIEPGVAPLFNCPKCDKLFILHKDRSMTYASYVTKYGESKRSPARP